MGHVVSPDREYRLLQQRLDRMLTGAPDSPVLMQILRLLFTPEEAELARRVPSKPISLDELSRKVNIPPNELGDKLTELAGRGLMLDFEHKGRRYFMLPPVVIGFFEFVFMRARDGMPMAELAKLSISTCLKTNVLGARSFRSRRRSAGRWCERRRCRRTIIRRFWIGSGPAGWSGMRRR